jgi:hypothetical protein
MRRITSPAPVVNTDEALIVDLMESNTPIRTPLVKGCGRKPIFSNDSVEIDFENRELSSIKTPTVWVVSK